MAGSRPGIFAGSESKGRLDYEDGDNILPRNEEDEWPTTDGRAALHRFMHGASTVERARTPASFGKNEPRMGSVFSRSLSPVQNFRFQSSTDKDEDAVHLDKFRGREIREKVVEGLPSSVERISRNDAVAEYGEEYDAREPGLFSYALREPERSHGYPPGDFHFVPSSRSQVDKTAEVSSGADVAGISPHGASTPPLPITRIPFSSHVWLRRSRKSLQNGCRIFTSVVR
jgi:hypothetical protein